jgi:hypothetical protein
VAVDSGGERDNGEMGEPFDVRTDELDSLTSGSRRGPGSGGKKSTEELEDGETFESDDIYKKVLDSLHCTQE